MSSIFDATSQYLYKHYLYIKTLKVSLLSTKKSFVNEFNDAYGRKTSF